MLASVTSAKYSELCVQDTSQATTNVNHSLSQQLAVKQAQFTEQETSLRRSSNWAAGDPRHRTSFLQSQPSAALQATAAKEQAARKDEARCLLLLVLRNGLAGLVTALIATNGAAVALGHTWWLGRREKPEWSPDNFCVCLESFEASGFLVCDFLNDSQRILRASGRHTAHRSVQEGMRI